jgi:hypothetical protein
VGVAYIDVKGTGGATASSQKTIYLLYGFIHDIHGENMLSVHGQWIEKWLITQSQIPVSQN